MNKTIKTFGFIIFIVMLVLMSMAGNRDWDAVTKVSCHLTNRVYTSDVYYFDTKNVYTNLLSHREITKCTPNMDFPITNSVVVTPDMRVWINYTTMTLNISNKNEVISIKGEFPKE
jgi:hypothetical protein